MDDAAVWTAIDRERSTLAEMFEGLAEDQWRVESLCDGWTVRDVLAHLSLAHPTPRWLLTNIVRARFDFNRMMRVTALRQAARPTAELTAILRGMVGSRRKAPGLTCREPLIDVLVHGQDVSIPLGISRAMPVEAAAEALRRVMTAPRWLSPAFPARSSYRAVRLVATDADVELGTGPRIEAPVQDLLLAVTGRRAMPLVPNPGNSRSHGRQAP